MLIDTHCHLHDLEWFTQNEQQDFLRQAHENTVEKIICIGTNPEDSCKARDFASRHDDVYWTYGIHPEFASSRADFGDIFSSVSKLFATNGERAKQEVPVTTSDDTAGFEQGKKFRQDLVAIGEIGLDYHYESYSRVDQIKLFEQMLQLALDYNLPVSLHIREAFEDAFAVLDNFPQIRGVVHSFTGSKRHLKQALERNFYIGVNGLCTYTTNPLPPIDRMILETDAPFLTPAPHRQEKNAPQYVKIIAEYLAETLQLPIEQIAETTTQNAEALFSL